MYSVLLKCIRKTGEAAFMPFKCDFPAAQCYMEMRILPLPDAAIEFQARMLRGVPRRPQPWSHGSSTKDRQELLEMCATCKRMNTQFGWLELELAVDRRDYFDQFAPPDFAHGLCDQCYNIFAQG